VFAGGGGEREGGHYAWSLANVVPPRLRAGVLALSAVLTTASLLGTALSPYLLVKNPLLLVAVSAAAHHVALAAATVDPASLITVATLRRTATGLCAYGLGYLYGHVVFEWVAQRYPRLSRWVSLVEELFARWGVALLIIAPAPTIALLAGAAKSRLLPFLAALALGHALWNSVTYYLGDAFARWTDLLTEFLRAHLLESTVVCFLAVALQQAVVRLVRRYRRVAVPSSEEPASSAPRLLP
jgi:membrane protein DedA with SNARE-associated domain